MENEYKELLEQYPFLRRIIDTIDEVLRMDERNWDNLIEKDFTKCRRVLNILKENQLIK
jgi:hypothetical protein